MAGLEDYVNVVTGERCCSATAPSSMYYVRCISYDSNCANIQSNESLRLFRGQWLGAFDFRQAHLLARLERVKVWMREKILPVRDVAARVLHRPILQPCWSNLRWGSITSKHRQRV